MPDATTAEACDQNAKGGFAALYMRVLRFVVLIMAWGAGGCICLMMLLTCMDVVGRFFGSPLHGTYDMVKLLGALGISLGLPYTTAVKGHVAVEFFFQNFARPVRLVLDVINRMLVVLLFGVLCFRSVQYGVSLAKAGEVTPTMEIPVFWIPYVLAFSCAIVVLVVLYNLIHPGKVMIKP